MAAAVHRTERGWRCGESHQNATRTDAEVEQVRALHDEGYGWRRIAKMLNLPRRWVNKVCAYARRPYVVPRWPTTDSNAPAERLR